MNAKTRKNAETGKNAEMDQLNVVAAILVCDGKILCMQRGAGKYLYTSFKYEFPGGKIEPGEKPTEALERELREEMDLIAEVKESDYFMTIHHRYPDFDLSMHCYVRPVPTFDFNRKEHTDHRWLPPQDLLQLDWAPADLPIVAKIMKEGLER